MFKGAISGGMMFAHLYNFSAMSKLFVQKRRRGGGLVGKRTCAREGSDMVWRDGAGLQNIPFLSCSFYPPPGALG